MNRDELRNLIDSLAEAWRTRDYGAAEYTYEGTHRYHGVVLLRVRDGKISHWREYQHIDAREWEDFASGTAF